MNRASEYRTNYVGLNRYSNVSPRVNTGKTVPAAAGANQHHLQKSRSDMIPATAVAIPTAHTHRSPRRTTFSRTTYTIVRTPNVSVVHRDPYALPSAEVSGAAYRRIASARPVSNSGGTAAFSATHHNRRERQLQSKVDVMEAKNRDLENRLLDLQREMMMMKAENTSSSRLYPNNAAVRTSSTQRVQQQQQRSYSANRASDVRQRNNYATAAPSFQRASGVLLSPPSRGRSAAPRSLPPQQRSDSGTRVDHTLHLVDELRDALLRGGDCISTIPTATTSKKTKKRKSSTKRAANAGDQLRYAIDHETSRYNNERLDNYHRQTSAVEVSRRERSDADNILAAHAHRGGAPLQSPSRPLANHPQRTSAMSSSTIYDDRHYREQQQRRHTVDDNDDEAFESLQRSYWSQSQAILEELDRKLKSLDVTRSH